MFRSRMNMLVAHKEHVEGRKITQVELAQETALARATISKWMSPANKMPRLDANTVYSLCGYFECSIEDLVEVLSN